MSSFEFDENGNIKPYMVHKASIEDVSECFVKPFEATKTTRIAIWKRYTDYTAEIKKRVPSSFTQLQYGSFLTKKQNPSDIDIVNVIHHSYIPLIEDIIQYDMKNRSAIDAITVPIFDEDHPSYTASQMILKKKVKFGLYDDRKKQRRGMVEVEIDDETV